MSMLLAGLALIASMETPIAAPPPAPKSQILGVWKGTSTCTKVEGNEFCRDEVVVYNVVDVPDQPATVSLKAARIVDDFIQPTYALYFTYRPETGHWTCAFDRPSHSGIWDFKVEGDSMTGTAILLPGKTIVRNVVAKRTLPEKVLAP